MSAGPPFPVDLWDSLSPEARALLLRRRAACCPSPAPPSTRDCSGLAWEMLLKDDLDVWRVRASFSPGTLGSVCNDPIARQYWLSHSCKRRNIMSRSLLAGLVVLILLVGNLRAAQDKEQSQKDFTQHTRVTITKIDAKKGEITVKYTDDKGKEEHKTFKLTRDVKIFDETGQIAAIDVFESGDAALILAAQGQLKELRLPAEAPPGQRLSDAVKTLIEMTDYEQGCVLEVQRIYDMLRKLDTGKN